MALPTSHHLHHALLQLIFAPGSLTEWLGLGLELRLEGCGKDQGYQWQGHAHLHVQSLLWEPVPNRGQKNQHWHTHKLHTGDWSKIGVYWLTLWSCFDVDLFFRTTSSRYFHSHNAPWLIMTICMASSGYSLYELPMMKPILACHPYVLPCTKIDNMVQG